MPSAAGPLPNTVRGTIPTLDEMDYEHGNVRRYINGTSAYLDPELAQLIPKGVRGQRAGLLYDSEVAGFDPLLWPHVLAGASGGGEAVPPGGVGRGGVKLARKEGRGARLVRWRFEGGHAR